MGGIIMEKSNKTFSKDSTDLLVAFFKSIALNYVDERHVCNKIIRLLLGASCAQLAQKVEVSKQTICNYESGKPVLRPVERVIEIELDLLIEDCDRDDVKDLCRQLQSNR